MTPEAAIEIAGRKIGPGQPPYIIAEMSGNHNGDLERALALVEAAAEAGADAVKLQTYTADTMTIDHDGDDFRVKGGLWDGKTLYELYEWAHTPWDWHEALFARGRELGVAVFSSPFDASAVDFLESLDAPAYKIASFEVVDLPLIEKVAKTGKPMIISTGMANLEEIGEAMETARAYGSGEIVLLHCISGYPTPPEEANLATLPDLARRFGAVAGLSDHTLGPSVPIAAVALGAQVIEKHFTLRRADGGPDSAFSLEPEELRQLCETAQTAWAALGRVDYSRKPSEAGSAVFRRSLYVVEDIAAGEPFTEKNLRAIRPGHGLPPKHITELLGRPAKTAIKRGTPLRWDLVTQSPEKHLS